MSGVALAGRGSACLGSLLLMLACDSTPLHPPGWAVRPEARILEPEPGVFLNRARMLEHVEDARVPRDRVSVTGLIPDELLDPETGYPLTGAAAHAALKESNATYAVLEAHGDYAPTTLEAWKARFDFPARGPDESLDQWRRRAKVFIYYNRTELGLGRELGCSEFDDRGETGLACFVSNYGATFGHEARSLGEAIRGEPVRNTVCIAYIPSLPAGARVQFFVYGSEGERQAWAQLDHLGPRPHPFVCTNCHGGVHDPERHLTVGARFLPTQPSHLSFAGPPPYDLASQSEFVRRVNALAYDTGAHERDDDGDDPLLTREQRTWLANLYDHDGGDIHTTDQSMLPHWAPPGWRESQRDADIWTKVVDPYCSTCHAAIDDDGAVDFSSPAGVRPFVRTSVCGSFSMPNAQMTSHLLWRPAPIEVDGETFASPADALLAWAGLDRARCSGLADRVASCLRDGLPDDGLCGNDTSGTVCLDSGTCGLDFATRDGADGPLGYCIVGGRRRCPPEQTCRQLDATQPDGWAGGGCFL